MADSTGEDVGRPAAPKKGRGSSWQYQETVALLQLWGQPAVQEELRTSHRNLETFERIAQAMRRRGFPRGAAECRTKTKKLKGEYKQALRRLGGGGGGGDRAGGDEARRWPFFRTLARILRQDPPERQQPTPPAPQPRRDPKQKLDPEEEEEEDEEDEEEEDEEEEERRDRPEIPARPPAFQDTRNEVLVKEEDADEAGEGSFEEPAAEMATPRISVPQPGCDLEGSNPAAAAALQPPTRLAWLRRRKTKSAKVESLLLQMLHQDAEEARETRESVERSWARMEAWARAEQESRAREAEREQRHHQEVLNCMQQTNDLIRRFMGDTSRLLRQMVEPPRTEAGEGGSAMHGASITGRTAPGSRLGAHGQAKRNAGSVDEAATRHGATGSATP